MKVRCHNCGDVMYRKPVLYANREFCEWDCKERWIDATAVIYGDPAQLQLPLESSHEVPPIPKT